MKTFDVAVIKFGFATIKAETKEEAMKIVDELATDDFEWSDDVEVTDCHEDDVE